MADLNVATARASMESLAGRAKSILGDGSKKLSDAEDAEVRAIIKHVTDLVAFVEAAGEKVVSAKVLDLTKGLNGPTESGNLLSRFKAAGFGEGKRATIPFWGRGYKTASFSGDLDDLKPTRREGVALGYDQRYIWPVFPSENVDSTTTSVQVLRQSSRTLAAPSAMIRALTDVTAKPETASVRALVTVPLETVASVESDIPNIILNSEGFAPMIERDLRLAYEDALDVLAIVAILDTSPEIEVTGADLVAQLVNARCTMAADGYDGRIVVLSCADFASLTLLKGADEQYARGDPLAGFSFRIAEIVGPNPILVDPDAIGKAYFSPVTLATFEQNAGETNSSTVRLEGNAAFNVERDDAVRAIGGALVSS